MFKNNNMKPHLLYKVNGNDDCLIFFEYGSISIYKSFDIRADNIIECNFLKEMTLFPLLSSITNKNKGIPLFNPSNSSNI